MKKLTLHRRAASSLRAGHPWVYREALVAARELPNTGESVQLMVSGEENESYFGIYDANSPLAVRVWSGAKGEVNAAEFRRAASRAFAVRAWMFADGQTTAYRMLHGEGDRTPGFTIDRYADVAVVRTDGDAARVRTPEFVEAVWPLLEQQGLKSLLGRDPERAGPPLLLKGDMPAARVTVAEHGVPFCVDLMDGQKTGAFLDQRENRRRVGGLVAKLAARSGSVRMLNLFSYAGGFSVFAARSGAITTSVDIAAKAHRTAEESFRAAGMNPGEHRFVAADAFQFLQGALERGERFDLIVCDPPSFAHNEKSVDRALAAYGKLHAACAAVLAEGGVLCAASCSSHVGMARFLTTLGDEVLSRADLRAIASYGPPADHPTLPGFPEGAYLKFVALA